MATVGAIPDFLEARVAVENSKCLIWVDGKTLYVRFPPARYPGKN